MTSEDEFHAAVEQVKTLVVDPGNSVKVAKAEADNFAQAATALTDYLGHSERIVLAVYARHISEAGWESRL